VDDSILHFEPERARSINNHLHFEYSLALKCRVLAALVLVVFGFPFALVSCHAQVIVSLIRKILCHLLLESRASGRK